jgi:hypothetical protein
MNKNSTFMVLGFILASSLTAGAATGYIAYRFGSEALTGVKSPQENPTQKLTKSKNVSSQKSQSFQIIPEKDILVQVYDYVYAQKEASKTKTEASKTKTENSSPQKSSQSKSETAAPSPQSSNSSAAKPDFPITGEDQGVKMEVANIYQEQGSLLLSVNLKNNSQNKVKFLYSFLDIKDEKNMSISAIADGLPPELPANGEEFSGKITIPLSLLSNSQTISMTLTDYPDQKITLNIPSIPISQ